MPNIINLGQLTNVEYNFLQVTSLEKTFGNFGFGTYDNAEFRSVVYTEIRAYSIILDIADLIGVSHTSITSLKAPQAYADLTGIALVDKSPVVLWSGSSMIYGVSYLSVDGKEEFAVVEYINGSINLIEMTSGEAKIVEYSEGSYNIIERAEGEFTQFNNIDGSRNLIEFIPGARKGG